MGPLEGMKVLELGTVVLGPLAGQMLADYGAEVIKIEAPGGDSTRKTGPSAEPGMSAIFLGCNRSKRSIVLDLKSAEGIAIVKRLAASADIFLHNMRAHKIAGLGLGPDVLTAANPRLIYAELGGFGADGPYSGGPAYDDIIQGLSGSAALIERQFGRAGYLPTLVGDKIGAHVATHAILAALVRRERTGRGGFVEAPMFEAVTAFNLVEHFYGQHFDPPLSAPGYTRILGQGRRPFRTADGHICMMPYTDANWRAFFAEVGAAGQADDPRFIGIANRTANIEALYALAESHIATRTTADWLATCARLDIPAARMNMLEDLIDDPHLHAVGFFAEHEDAASGTVRFPGVPVRFDGERLPVAMPPRLGEHSRAILIEAGIAPAECDDLFAAGISRQA